MSTTTLELVQYYSSLLIKQYSSKANAVATIQASVSGMVMPQISTQQITYSVTPTSGSYVLSYNGNNTTSLLFSASDSQIQTALRLLPGLSNVTVLNQLVTFTGVIPPALSLIVESNSLEASGISVEILITETDLTLPLAIQNAYNLTVQPYAVGVQLDVLGKYAGVTRNGTGFLGQPITLNDSDFLKFVQIAITQNSSGSSLYDIVNNLYQFFGNNIIPFDYKNMHMSYLISTSIGSINLLELFVTEGLLPAPMAVAIVVIVLPTIDNLFGFITYTSPVQPADTRPFNNYQSYQTDWTWISYQNVFSA